MFFNQILFFVGYINMKLKRNMYVMLICIFIVMSLGAVAYYMLSRSSLSASVKEKFAEAKAVAKEPAQPAQPKVRVMLFYATWCPHCERYLETGVYDTFQQKIDADTAIQSSVSFEKFDYDKNSELGDKYGISSFPTIIALDNNEKVYRFNGSRDSDVDMKEFIKAVIDQKTLGPRDYN
jgi:thiol-disulfide isomerase/thioredoxin